MKPKRIQNMDLCLKSPLQTHKFDAPVYVGSSMNNSTKKSSRSTYLTERSSSRNKVMIPNSPKLANFFNSSRPHSSHKSFSTTSTQDQVARKGEQNQEQDQRSKKIEFLKYNVNRDYFDEITEQNLKERPQRCKEVLAKNGQPNTRTLFLREADKRDMKKHLNRQNTYRSETLIRPERALELPKIKHPNPKQLPHHFFAKPIDKLNTTKEKAKKKMDRYELSHYQGQAKGVQNSLEYTFGLNY